MTRNTIYSNFSYASFNINILLKYSTFSFNSYKLICVTIPKLSKL